MDVVGLGQVSLDRVARVPAWPAPGARLALPDAPAERPGGQVATALLAAVRLGLRARLLAAVGDDAAGVHALAPLRDAGVDLAHVRRVAGAPTRTAWLLVDARDGERAVLGFRDPRLALTPALLSRAMLREARALLVDAEDPEASAWAVAAAREAGIPSVLDVDAADPARVALARQVDFPIVSREFSRQLSGSGGERETLRRLTAAPVRMAVVTCGGDGALARCGEAVLVRPAFGAEVRDTTGAGDVFRGTFVWGLLRGGSGRQVLAWAAAAAALACAGLGAQGALPSAEEVTARAAGQGWSG